MVIFAAMSAPDAIFAYKMITLERVSEIFRCPFFYEAR